MKSSPKSNKSPNLVTLLAAWMPASRAMYPIESNRGIKDVVQCSLKSGRIGCPVANDDLVYILTNAGWAWNAKGQWSSAARRTQVRIRYCNLSRGYWSTTTSEAYFKSIFFSRKIQICNLRPNFNCKFYLNQKNSVKWRIKFYEIGPRSRYFVLHTVKAFQQLIVYSSHDGVCTSSSCSSPEEQFLTYFVDLSFRI